MNIFNAIIYTISLSKSLVLAGCIVMVMLILFKKTLMRPMGLAGGVLPLIAVPLGAIVGPVLATMLGADPIEVAISVASGMLAVTLWESLAQYFFKKE